MRRGWATDCGGDDSGVGGGGLDFIRHVNIACGRLGLADFVYGRLRVADLVAQKICGRLGLADLVYGRLRVAEMDSHMADLAAKKSVTDFVLADFACGRVGNGRLGLWPTSYRPENG